MAIFQTKNILIEEIASTVMKKTAKNKASYSSLCTLTSLSNSVKSTEEIRYYWFDGATGYYLAPN